MTLSLDTRSPIFVLAAGFNPSIFTLPWMARHLFGHDEGAEVPYAEYIIQNPAEMRQIAFIEGVSVCVTGIRTEIFVIDGQLETFARAEAVVSKMVEVLPHTPMTALGCNLIYVDDDPGDDLTNLFITPEGFEAEGALNSRQAGVQLEIDESAVLNFTRQWTPQDVRFSFNYHRNETVPENYLAILPGYIGRAIAHSETILKSLYRYENHDVIGFLPPVQEEVENAPEIG